MAWRLYQFCLHSPMETAPQMETVTSAPLLPTPTAEPRVTDTTAADPLPSSHRTHASAPRPHWELERAGHRASHQQANTCDAAGQMAASSPLTAEPHQPHGHLQAGKLLMAVIPQVTSVKSLHFPSLHLGTILTDWKNKENVLLYSTEHTTN